MGIFHSSLILPALSRTGFASPLVQTLASERSQFQLAQEKGYTRITSRGVPSTAEPGKPELPEKLPFPLP